MKSYSLSYIGTHAEKIASLLQAGETIVLTYKGNVLATAAPACLASSAPDVPRTTEPQQLSFDDVMDKALARIEQEQAPTPQPTLPAVDPEFEREMAAMDAAIEAGEYVGEECSEYD